MLRDIKVFYDVFSFDGVTRLYNPFSILQFFNRSEFNNYWYDSGSPTFIVEYLKKHKINDPELYRHCPVKSDFTSSLEIERAEPQSFLFQSGYLTIEKKENQLLILDYPNREVLDSISSVYLEIIYKIETYAVLTDKIWKSLADKKLIDVVRIFNTALACIPYEDYLNNRNEYWYRSLFLMLLRGAGLITYSEPHSSKGCADIVIQFTKYIIVIEFKFAEKTSDVENKKKEGMGQIEEKGYLEPYKLSDKEIIYSVFVADDEKRAIVI